MRMHETQKFGMLLFTAVLLLMTSVSYAGDVTVNWNANSESDLDGYKVYYDTAPVGVGAQVVDAQSATSYTFQNLQDGLTYYFRITAYDFSANESAFSAEVSITVGGDGPTPNPPELILVDANGPTQIDVSFSEPLDIASAQNSNNYFISNGVQVIAAFLDVSETVVHLLTSQHQNGTYTLTVSNVEDKDGNAILAGSAANYTIAEDGGSGDSDSTPPNLIYAVAVDDTHLDVIFSENIESASSQNTGNYAVTNSIQVLQAVLQSNQSIVRLTTTSHQVGTYTLTVTSIQDVAGNVIGANNSYQYTFDPNIVTRPELVSVDVEGRTQINLNFSEPLEKISAENGVNYSISKGVTVTNAVLDANSLTVHLLTSNHENGQYTVTVNNVRNLAGLSIVSNNEAAYTIDLAETPKGDQNGNLPINFSLFQNYPNPFNPETEIRFFLDKTREIELKVYNQLGQLVKSLVKNNLSAGYHTIVWDGTNNKSIDAPSGVYIYSLEIKRNVVKDNLLVSVALERRVRRMTLIR